MAVKRVAYVEPEDYFPKDVKKFMDDWDKKNAAKGKQTKKVGKTSGGKKK